MLLSAYIVPHPPIILPEIGKGAEHRIQKTIDSYHKIAKEIAELQPETIVVISSHAPSYIDYIHISPGKRATGDFGKFHHPECGMSVDYDIELVDRISSIAKKNHVDAGKRGDDSPTLDHGTMIPLYFINQYYDDYQVVRVSVSGLSAEEHDLLGQCIGAAAEELDRKIIVIASGDLSHRLSDESPYGFAKEGAVFDECMVNAMRNNDLCRCATMDSKIVQESAQCGLPTFQILHGVLQDSEFVSEFYSYEHPFGIGYAICAFRLIEQDPYLQLVRSALSYYLETEKIMKVPKEFQEQFHEHSGVFVSLYKKDSLRGCIGSIHPLQSSLGEEIIHNAISAAFHDPRFPAVKKKELKQLEIHVDVLAQLEPVFFPDELDVKRYGIIVTSGIKRGVLLPNINDIHTPEQQIQIALQKAGIASDEFYTMERFSVEHH